MVTFNEYVSQALAKSALFKKVTPPNSGMSNAYTGQITKSASDYKIVEDFKNKLITGAKNQRDKKRYGASGMSNAYTGQITKSASDIPNYQAVDLYQDSLIDAAKLQEKKRFFGGQPMPQAFNPDPFKPAITDIIDGIFKPLDPPFNPQFPPFDPFNGGNSGFTDLYDDAKNAFSALPIILIGGIALFLVIKGGK